MPFFIPKNPARLQRPHSARSGSQDLLQVALTDPHAPPHLLESLLDRAEPRP